MKKSAKPKLSLRQRLSKFFKETFRARDKNDYKEFFTRGLRGQESRAKTEYAWMYVRVFVLLFVLFNLVAFLIAFAENGIAYPMLYFLGGAFMNLTVAVFIYELNPERNMSFVMFILIMIVGTAAADFIAIMGYCVYYPENEWLATLWTAVLEELSKAIPAILAVIILKRRSPMLGFIIGAAIGAGFSITEDMGYIAYSWGVYGMVDTSIERALTAVCTHTLWTAVIGWAFCKFKCRPYDLRFLLVVLSSILLHFVWDMPVEFIFAVLPTALCVIAAIVFSFKVVKKECKSYREAEAASGIQLAIPIPENKCIVQPKRGTLYSKTANLVATVTAVLVGILFISWCYAPVDYVEFEERFKTEEEFIEFVQGDKNFIADWDKQFDYNAPVSDFDYCIIVDGKFVYATVNVEAEDGNIYSYYFEFYKDGETDETVSRVTSIAVNVGEDERYWLARIAVPEAETPEGITYRYVDYVIVNAYSCYYDTDTQEFVALVDWYSDHTAEIVVSAVAVGVLLVGAVTFTVLKIKSKKLRRKENVGQ